MAGVNINIKLNNNDILAFGLSRFTYIPSGRPYIVYTLNEKHVDNGVELNKLYISEEGDETTPFQPISDDEWVNLRNILLQIKEANAEIPNNIQYSQIIPSQTYIVGPYRRVAIKDEEVNNLVNNQMNNQPKEEQIVKPTSNSQFFDPSLNVSAMEENTTQAAEVPNAFTMSTPVPEEAAPVSLVENTPTPQVAPVVAPVETTVQTQLIDTTPQPIEMPQQVDELTKVKESVQTIINYCNGDKNKLNELFKEQGMDISIPQVDNTPKEEFPEPTTGIIDINNIPVVEQQAPAEEHVLNEESFEPTTPTLPVNTMDSAQIVAQTPISEIQNNIVSQVEPVMNQVESVPQAPVVEVQQPVQAAPAPQMIQPVQVAEPTPTIPVEPVAQTTIVEPTQLMPNNPSAVETIQNTEVKINVPEDLMAPPTPPTQSVEMPTIPVAETNNNSNVISINAITQDAINTSDFLDAGPVVMPDGQENIGSIGLPGDSGAKVLEKVA